MIRVKDHKQGYLFDPWGFLGPKRRRLLDQSWAGLFQNEILCELPVANMAPFFDNSFGRPTKELYTSLGALVLQQTLDLTDEETIHQLAFDIQWHYALNISEDSDSAKYMSLKTLWNMRKIVMDNDLDVILFDCIANKLRVVFNVDTDAQRIDSVHIKSNMRRLGRIGIFVSAIHKFLVNLKRGHRDMFASISPELTDKYISKKAVACFSMVKPSDSAKTLSSVSTDLFDLIQQFKGNQDVIEMHSYKLLERILKEQCNLTESDNQQLVEIKTPKEIPSDSLQNPSDPDATYSGHKGQGYQVQVMETYCTDAEAKDNTLNLITHVHVEPAHESDANALLPAIESTQRRDCGPKEVVADTLYGSDENCQKAARLEVEVIAPVQGRPKKGAIELSDFSVSPQGDITACPEGHDPVMITQNRTRPCVAFDCQHCSNCPRQSDCPVKQGKRYYYLRFTDKELRASQRRVYVQTEEFKDRYRWRAGVEATMSEYDRRTGVKRQRFRGLKAMRFCATLKAAGLNILRATAVRKALNRVATLPGRLQRGPKRYIFVVKEHCVATFRHLTNVFVAYARGCRRMFARQYE